MSGKRKFGNPGEKYGRLTIVKEIDPYILPSSGKKCRRVLCTCSCDGKEVEVLLNHLRSGNTTSCGCYAKEIASKTGEKRKKENRYIFNEDGSITGYTFNNEPFYFDEDDFEIIKKYCWCSVRGYIVSTVKDGKQIRMHRLITNAPDSMDVDHINHNPSDNRKENLRICKHADNMKNIPIKSNNNSGVIGVGFSKKENKWRARITVNGKEIALGYFSTKEEAAKARYEAELLYFGNFSPNYEKLTQQQSNQQSQQNT